MEGETLGTIYFFTAIRKDYKQSNRGKYDRHKIYIKALQSLGIIVIEGRFLKKEKEIKCLVEACERPPESRKFVYTTREEKRTDVNVACYLVRDAFLNNFDKAFVFSADTDLVPALEIVRERFEEKKLIIGALPSIWSKEDQKFYFPKIKDLIEASGSNLLKLNFLKLREHLLPKSMTGLDGRLIKVPECYLCKEDMEES